MDTRRFFAAAAMAACLAFSANAQVIIHNKLTEPTSQPLPEGVPSLVTVQGEGNMHVQGLAIDRQRGQMYFSFTTVFYKTDLQGNVIGSIEGIQGHLGAMTYDESTHKVYASLECKNDEVGKGIADKLGVDAPAESMFYVAVIDVDKVDKVGMNAFGNPAIKTVFIRDAYDDYAAEVPDFLAPKPTKKVATMNLVPTHKHRYGCAGIDGVTIAPKMKKDFAGDGKNYLYVAYGIYGDVDRKDNDHQVLLRYDFKKLEKYAMTIEPGTLHKSGPSKAEDKYFVLTGNTRYGVQNLAYDPYLHVMFMAVYSGNKSKYPNYDLYAVDVHRKPYRTGLEGVPYQEKGVKHLYLTPAGLRDQKSATRGWRFKWGSTGFCPVGGGYYIISENFKKADSQIQGCNARLYYWTGNSEEPFAPYTR